MRLKLSLFLAWLQIFHINSFNLPPKNRIGKKSPIYPFFDIDMKKMIISSSVCVLISFGINNPVLAETLQSISPAPSTTVEKTTVFSSPFDNKRIPTTIPPSITSSDTKQAPVSSQISTKINNIPITPPPVFSSPSSTTAGPKSVVKVLPPASTNQPSTPSYSTVTDLDPALPKEPLNSIDPPVQTKVPARKLEENYKKSKAPPKAAPATQTPLSIEEVEQKLNKVQSKGWELARQKRTAAVNTMAKKGIIKVDTDDIGNQFLSLPWIPNNKIAYKSLSLKQRLTNEVFAGAFGEISKDLLLHSVDTLKIRKQMQKKTGNTTEMSKDINKSEIHSNHIGIMDSKEGILSNSVSFMTEKKLPEMNVSSVFNKLLEFKALYAGFPIVFVSSFPQGGVFFLVKKGVIEYFNVNLPDIPEPISATVPIFLGAMAYWLFRTPAEVLKTQVQTGQLPSIPAAISDARKKYPNGLLGLWKHYTVMLSLDIPFQIINFVLYGIVSDTVGKFGFPPNILSRLFCGASCGMISAAVTCPIDVCKTRIVARDKKALAEATKEPVDVTVMAVELQEEKEKEKEEIMQAETEVSSRTQVALGLIKDDLEMAVGSLVSSAGNVVNAAENVVYNASSSFIQLGTNFEKEIESLIIPASESSEEDVRINAASSAEFRGFSEEMEGSEFGTVKEKEKTIKKIVLNNDEVEYVETGIQSHFNIAKENKEKEIDNVKKNEKNNNNVFIELLTIVKDEGVGTLFLGFNQRLLYTGLANGIRLAAYGTSRMDLMMKSLDDL